MLHKTALFLTVAVALLALVQCEVAFPKETQHNTVAGGGSADAGGGTGGTSGSGGTGNCFPSAGQKFCGGQSCPAKTNPEYGCASSSCAPCSLPNATANCAADGTCGLDACNAGFDDCDHNATNGCEINTASDPHNCGACGNDCFAKNPATNWICKQGACQVSLCATGKGDCNNNPSDGCETDLTTDPNNCGFCGNVCNIPHATASCVAGKCTLAKCDAGWADCNNNPSDGCEQDIATDPAHCGSCTNACSSVNGKAACVGGNCTIACQGGYGNCDGNTANGCETKLDTDPQHCGTCSNACSTNNSTSSCSSGTCQLSCKSGYADCNTNPGDGCEASLSAVSTCGSCTNDCTSQVQHATATCASGSCSYAGGCSAGWGDCDGKKANGCERNLGTDVNNCGSCGYKCSNSVKNASGLACANGACTYTGSCSAGWGDCDGNKANGCETALTLPATCGSCSNDCTTTVLHVTAIACSVSGTCSYSGACDATWGDCDGNKANGCETNLTTDTHCGSCATQCGASKSCTYIAGGWSCQ